MNGFCDKVVWLNKGNVVGIDVLEKIIMPYFGFAREFNAMSNDERNDFNVNLRKYQEKFL